MYWIEQDERMIEKAGMDGREDTRKAIVNFDYGSWPTGLALDYEIKRMFWVDARKKSVYR